MFAVLACLQQHDLKLLACAVLVCLAACVAASAAVRRAQPNHGARRRAWIALSAIMLGSGVWSTHFLAMLAFQPGVQIAYGFGLTAVSLLLAVATMFAGISMACSSRRRVQRAGAGAVCGAGVAIMHYTGVAAMDLPAFILWNLQLVATSVVIGLAGSAWALALAGEKEGSLGRRLAPVAMTLTICSMHLIGMASVTLIPDGRPPVGSEHSHAFMIAWVSTFAGLMLAGGFGMLLVDRVSRASLQGAVQSGFDNAPTAMAIFGADERLMFWNVAYGQFMADFGVTPERGMTLAEGAEAVMASVGAEAISSELAAARGGESGRLRDYRAPDGRAYETRLSRSAEGLYVVTIGDITERLNLVAREAEARRLAEEASRAKSEFLANMSHEIRTPLNGVMGVAGALARTPLTAPQQEMVSIVENSAKTLEALLSDILDLARVEAGKMELRPEAFDLVTSVRACGALFDAAAQAKGLDLEVLIAPEAPGAYVGDATRIRQILSNLLSNAVKFTERGKVSLRVGAVRGETRSELRFEVADTGIGFDAETKARLFSRFEQADGSITRRFGGSGLGLSISSALAEVMGGRLEAEATAGQGATFAFVVELPRTEGALDIWDLANDEPQADPLAGLRVLLAEDHPTNRRVVELILGAAGVDLTCVENGAEAVAAFEAGVFDLILMDMQMPVMDGLTAIDQIRKREAAAGLARTPIHVLTANAMPEHVSASREAGADGHISKPIVADKLLEVVADVALTAAAHQAALARRVA